MAKTENTFKWITEAGLENNKLKHKQRRIPNAGPL